MPVIIEKASVVGQHQVPNTFPLVYASDSASLDDSVAWIKTHRETLIAESQEHGAVLLRGLPVNSDQDFDRCIRAFGLANFTYQESLSNAVRINRTERVFTANEAPPDVSIYLHHEMAQTPVFPGKLFFFCEQAAEVSGATPICRSDRLYSALTEKSPEFLGQCERLGVRYASEMPALDNAESGQGRSWASTLSVDDKQAAERKLAALGYDWQWQADGSLRVTTPKLPAVRALPDGRKVFFNQLIAAYRGWKNAESALMFGDYSPLPVDAMETVCALADEMTFDLAWQTGDVAIIDNYLVMHGRRPFQGKRRVLVSLAAVATAA